MGSFGGYYFGERKKPKKEDLEKKARKLSFERPFVLPKVEIVSKKKSE
jgi:hypothetical protein